MANIPTEWWPNDRRAVDRNDVLDGPFSANLEVERTEPDEIALHTMVGGEGSHNSYYFSREQAISLAFELLQAAQLR